MLKSKTNCIHCGSRNVQCRGKTQKGTAQQFSCNQCKKFFTDKGAPKILVLDIETSHILFEGWDIGDQYVRPDQIIQDWFVICWSAKWLFGDRIYSDMVTSKEAIARDDRRCLEGIHKLMDECEIVVTQNGDKFDLRKLNWKFLKYGMKPNNHYLSIDTLKKSRAVVDPTSHGLNSVMRELGYSGKEKMENDDWRKAEAGDTVSIKKLSHYCNHDVEDGETWYLILRPWMKTHPQLTPYMELYQTTEDEKICPKCMQSIHDSKFSKTWYSLAGKAYKRTNCPHCGSVIRVSLTKFRR